MRDLAVPIAAEDPVSEPLMQEDISIATGDHIAGPSSATEFFFIKNTDDGETSSPPCHLLAGLAESLPLSQLDLQLLRGAFLFMGAASASQYQYTS
jgi:hypothetical protein